MYVFCVPRLLVLELWSCFQNFECRGGTAFGPEWFVCQYRLSISSTMSDLCHNWQTSDNLCQTSVSRLAIKSVKRLTNALSSSILSQKLETLRLENCPGAIWRGTVHPGSNLNCASWLLPSTLFGRQVAYSQYLVNALVYICAMFGVLSWRINQNDAFHFSPVYHPQNLNWLLFTQP